MKVDVVTTEDGDWIALYVDGAKVAEGHSLSEKMVLDAIGIEFSLRELSSREVEDMGYSFPEAQADLPPAQ